MTAQQMRSAPRNYKFAVVVPTIGVRANLARLVTSVVAQGFPETEIVVVNQGDPQAVAKQLSGLSAARVKVVETHPGVSHARNIGIRSLSGQWDIVGMLDDDCWYEEKVFAHVAAAVAQGADAVSTRVHTDEVLAQNRVGFGAELAVLNSRSVWTHAMESGSFFTRGYVDDVGLFDEELGIGAATPWQSGEGTDLFLRGIEGGKKIAYLPYAIIREDPLAPMSHAARLQRHRKYARGTGRVVSKRSSRAGQVKFVVRTVGKVVFGLRHLSVRNTSIDIYVLLGRLEGLCGKTLSREQTTSH